MNNKKTVDTNDGLQYIRIESEQGRPRLNLKELYQYRELFLLLIWRDVKVRYKQTILGAAWAILQPVFTMIIFSIFFGNLAGIPSDGIPYPIFSYAALVPWTFFANGISQSSNSLVGNTNLLTKIYFPRMIMPVSTILSGLVDFGLAFCILIVMMMGYKIPISVDAIWIIPLIILTAITAMGVGLWLSALNVQFRDIRYVLPFLVQAWLFITPIAYPSSLLAERWKVLYSLNPMAGVVEGFRWALLGANTFPGLILLVSSLMAILIFISGLFFFRRMEDQFADLV